MSTPRPVRLRPDNFTPATRTPWGGTRIPRHYKRDLDLSDTKRAYAVVGESWEVSVDPSFPSLLAEEGGTLTELLAHEPEVFLGAAERARYGSSTPMLIKLLDAAQALSVQVHPADDYPALAAHESGKPECWYVLHASPGAGLYLGFTEGATRTKVAALLAEGGDLTAYLNFVPVQPGDCFVIRPGTVHAIGAGVTLVEPQLVLPGKTGKTYRFWDWNRRYDSDGRPSDDGAPRELHVQDSLSVADFAGPRGAAAVDALRPKRVQLARQGEVEHHLLAELQDMRVERVRGSGSHLLTLPDALVAALVVHGEVNIRCEHGHGSYRRGEALVVPACVAQLQLELADAELVLAHIA